MDISPRERALGGHFYGRIRKLMQHEALPPRQGVEGLRRLLLELFERATEGDKLHFSTTYARVTYAAHKYGLSRQLIYQERSYRRTRPDLIPESALVAQLHIGCRLLTELTEALFGAPIPDDLVAGTEVAYPIYQKPEVRQHFYQLRVLVLEINGAEQEVIVREERRPEMVYRIPYGDPELADSPVREAVTILEKISGPFVTLNLINTQLREPDRLYPSQLVIEPDFLVNVTDVAYCFSSGSSYQPWSSLPNRLLPFEKRPPLVRGNIVNTFLDLLVQDPDIRFADVLPRIFEMQPLELCLFSDREVRDLVDDLKHHFLTVSRFVRELLADLDIERDKVMLEPTFLSPAYGLQGRLDLLQSQRDTEEGLTSIVELKTSKIYNPNVHGIRSDNFIQTVLYDLMINQALGKEANVRSYILYSVDYDKPIRYAPPQFTRQMEALSARNQLVGLEMMIAQLGQPLPTGELPDLARQTDALFARLHPSRFKNLGRFTESDHQAVLGCYQKLGDLERRYFGAYLGFVAREQRLAKIGEQRIDHLNGLASLWLDDRADKVERFELLDGLRFADYNVDTNILVLRRAEDDDILVKFRQGDIVALYGTPDMQTRAGDAVRSQIFKSTIVEVSEEALHLRPRNRQLNDSAFRRKPYWAVEKDVLDSSFRNHYLGLYLWAEADPEFRRRWLGLVPPRRAEPHASRISEELTVEQDTILRKIITAPDYFLLWGPPGTGKTSKMLHHLVRHLLTATEENVLLVAYTNRAVDEICESIERIRTITGEPFRDYLRIGSRLGTSEAYADRLLQVRSQGVTRRKDLRELVDTTRIVVGTVASVGGNNELFKLKSFDRVIVDEASQILEPLLGTLLTRAPRSLLIGDHRQLPAVVQQADHATYVIDETLRAAGIKDLANSLFERLFLTAKSNGWTWVYDQLRHQGRMHREVMAFPALHFYHGQLDILPDTIDHHHRQIEQLQLVAGEDRLEQRICQQRLVFIDTPADETSSDPKVNQHEADTLVQLVRAFQAVYARTDRPIRRGDIGIITPYRAQIALIRRRLVAAGFSPDDYTVDTVERYQGSAKRIVLMSLCTNDRRQVERLAQVSDEGVDRKLNVAMTRAREHLVLVGCPEILQESDVYAKLLEHVRTTPVNSCN
ncbi:DNA replication ATP-dependent helicase Dna2 [Neolewinella xylanilytica]|uniref:DNA replication ATP-dependent helicase Dna2 n=1 Tax=Neolewinella xylanilytica TaxID=1514080 RepID=A0A2S6HZW6_9BACT|nr:AAA domain-containing protein [Neolewinella xylanilytica]PPK84057.1 DNA replication ATP-dependent helicase Dna2 [Neolewinella xylanilytica]